MRAHKKKQKRFGHVGSRGQRISGQSTISTVTLVNWVLHVSLISMDFDFQDEDMQAEVRNKEGLLDLGESAASWVSWFMSVQWWISTSKRKTGRPARTSMRK